MDPASMPAAGSRPAKQTYDQPPQTRVSQQNRSDIFGVTNQPAPQTYSRQSQRPKTDIFSAETPAPAKQPDVSNPRYGHQVRKTNTYQSTIFAVDNTATNTHTNTNTKTNANFERSNKEVKQYQGKNNEHRAVDHGKEFLFGKSDFDEYKSLKRAQTLSEFKPKHDYDPANRRNQELYGNEIAREHLPTKQVNLAQQKPQKNQKKDEAAEDPAARKQIENSSSIFGESPVKRTSNKVEKLTASTQKWSNTGGQSKNDVKEFDPDTYAKSRKEKELESTIFGEGTQNAATKQQQQKPEEPEKPKQQPKQQKPKERLIPNNQTWTQTDSVKNMKDFNPTQSQVEGEVDPNQKKQDTLKSALDTHQYEGKQVPKNEKISNKNLKYKKDIITRDDGKQAKNGASKKPAQAEQQQQQQQGGDDII